jgi:hypothetical protein
MKPSYGLYFRSNFLAFASIRANSPSQGYSITPEEEPDNSSEP